ncbi:pyrroline-5-carboxylate reductase [Candidatus Odyssella thessalonicensis]|uniref:pyrroline-5-carboxylate reductase n=1 Tax=Candidatus Odyssella thessalonicensis TaxID=84647 RepID=UPI000495DAF4|nr:pyrroline-5-carboxylate reductase [Candidatus Odyssella thessalonicensis]
MKILLVGYGRMGQALAQQWLSLSDLTLTVISPHSPKHPNFFNQLGDLPSPNKPDLIVFAVKPQVLSSIAADYKPLIGEHTIIVSVAAGISLASLKQWLGESVVRLMPNLPVTVNQGVIGAYAPQLTHRQRLVVEKLLKGLGSVIWVEREVLIDAITAISGSGPAYYYYFTECLARAGQSLGLPLEVAQELAQQTFIGSAAVLAQLPDKEVSELRAQVTSPQGTTAAALQTFEQQNLNQSILKAAKAAFQRAQELSK